MKPTPVNDVFLVFPTDVSHLMPSNEEGYADYRSGKKRGTWGFKLFHDLFYFGVTEMDLKPKEGVDGTLAARHIKSIMGSFEPKHQEKEAACAFLFEHWFESATWKRHEPKSQ